MKINGFGEFESLRKTTQKDTRTVDNAKSSTSSTRSSSSSDAVQISPEARLYSQMAQISDVREDKIAEVKAKMEAGTLVTSESVREGIQSMLESM